ncbi:coiled-coil domain-containing protein 43 [Sinocyclocheilus rhinocerous]|uniref:Coiled-coil domain-containing protein 43 n=1 Tax=Sinocyclocheilus rhinocerous TaxID=307959 RepID=A0A673NFY3_9TELE|nr:PREDICTED: coiled-coil domain-containing protein 43 [Sinocyclocheilus rhinocerous]
MAEPNQVAGEFENWLNERLDSLEVDREVYGAYILGVLQEEESDEEQKDALQGILSAFLEEDTLEEVCQQILKQWTECCSRSVVKGTQADDEVQAIASLIEKQAQIVVKQKEVSEEAKKRKEVLLAQYAHVTDEEDEDDEEEQAAVGLPSEKSMFKNTNVEEVLNRRKQQRDQAREDAQKKKEQDKMQREKDKLAKQERKDKEKKRTQKGERKR